MNAVECRNCSRPVQDGAELCLTCADGLITQLRSVEVLIENLFISYAKQDRLGAGGGHRGRLSESPMPVRFDITRVIDSLSNTMTTWARVLVDHHGWDVPNPPRRRPHNGLRGVVIPASSPSVDLACFAAEWLAEHVGQLRQHPAAMEAHRELTGAIESAETAIDKPEPDLYVGDCELCSHSLYAPRDATGIKCEGCGAYVNDLSDRWKRAKLKLRGYPATAAVIAGWVGEVYDVLVNRKRINDWHYRGTLRKVDDDPDTGDPRFRIGEVLDRAAKSKPRKAG